MVLSVLWLQGPGWEDVPTGRCGPAGGLVVTGEGGDKHYLGAGNSERTPLLENTRVL